MDERVLLQWSGRPGGGRYSSIVEIGDARLAFSVRRIRAGNDPAWLATCTLQHAGDRVVELGEFPRMKIARRACSTHARSLASET